MRTRIKICGITNLADLRVAVAAGADALGFNLFAGSPRYVTTDVCASLVREVPALVTTVGLLVNPDRMYVSEILRQVPFSVLQFHGDEDDAFCASFGRSFLKAIRVGRETDIEAEVARFPSASALMLDAKVDGIWGGTGHQLDWSRVPRLEVPVVLAGGLSPANVAAAMRQVRPYAVDVSSGVEAGYGRKDPALVHAFVAAVERADEEIYD